MGLFDFLGGGNPDKAIAKHRKRLTDPYRQSHERYLAMDELVKLGSRAALDALLERFTIRVNGPTVDEEEKTYCYQLIASIGEDAVEPVVAFIQHNNAVYFPLRALRDIAGDDKAVDTLLEAMGDINPGYHDGLDRLREIVSNLRDFQHDRVKEALSGLLTSRSDEIRFYALDGLATYPNDQVIHLFVERLSDADESQRVKALACELAIEHEMTFKDSAAEVALGLGEQYQLNSEFRVVRRA